MSMRMLKDFAIYNYNISRVSPDDYVNNVGLNGEIHGNFSGNISIPIVNHNEKIQGTIETMNQANIEVDYGY